MGDAAAITGPLGYEMTTTEIESYLAKHYPDHQFTVSDKLGIGLPMADGVMLFAPVQEDIEAAITYVIANTKGKQLQ